MISLYLSFMALPSCDSYTMQVDDLISAIPDAWDDSENDISEHANAVLQELADDPDMLANEVRAEYSNFLDRFTLTKPFDQVGRAVSSALFGDFGDMVNALDAAKIENMTKKDVSGYINKNYNRYWTMLFAALCARDGKFRMSYETDSFIDKDFEYKPAELMKMINEHVSLTDAYCLHDGDCNSAK